MASARKPTAPTTDIFDMFCTQFDDLLSASGILRPAARAVQCCL